MVGFIFLYVVSPFLRRRFFMAVKVLVVELLFFDVDFVLLFLGLVETFFVTNFFGFIFLAKLFLVEDFFCAVFFTPDFLAVAFFVFFAAVFLGDRIVLAIYAPSRCCCL